MKRIIDTSEVLGTVETPEGLCELCASGDASFEEDPGRLVVRLEAFLRPTDLLVKERHFRADWLPENETVTESVGHEECHEVAGGGSPPPIHTVDRLVREVRCPVLLLHPPTPPRRCPSKIQSKTP